MPAPTPRRRGARLGACAAALVLVATAQAPASADVGVFTDQAGDVPSGVDLLRVRVTNADKVIVRTTHRDLRPKQYDGLTIYFDLGARRPGPEYALWSGLGDTRDWNVSRVRRWNQVRVVECASEIGVNYVKDAARAVLERDCLGGHQGRIRIAVKVVREQQRDWLGARRQLSDWVRR